MNFPENFAFILFGATGDLAYRKLIPALYQAIKYNAALLKGHFIFLGRSSADSEHYFQTLEDVLKKNDLIDFQADEWQEFKQRSYYFNLDAHNLADFQNLSTFLTKIEVTTRIFYLSTSPFIFKDIIHHLGQTGLQAGDSRIILEKPLGYDLQSASDIHQVVRTYFEENQVYRIDHYLGKESVQNLMALRFGNRLLEPLWNRVHIRSVQITISEAIGIETRGSFYDKVGAVRDMVQNHLVQLLCFIAMESPYDLSPDAIRDEKLKVLKSIVPYDTAEHSAFDQCILGQYGAGMIAGKPVCAYLDESDIPASSRTETYAALKIFIENWRWASVPFFLRTGKRMAETRAEIVIQFRSVPHNLFSTPQGIDSSNVLVINLQPDDDMQLYLSAKPPGYGNHLQPVSLGLNFSKQLSNRRPTAYERLLTDAIRGDLSLFVRHDEMIEAWHKMMPILWMSQQEQTLIYPYAAGSWGVSDANMLLKGHKTLWHEENRGFL